MEPVQNMRGAGCHHARQSAHAVATVGQHRNGRGPRQVRQNRAKPAVGPFILAGDEAEVAVIAAGGHGLADHDLEIAFFVIPVPDVAAIDANHDRGIDASEYGNLVLVKNAGKGAPPLARFDADGNGKLAFPEYVKLVEALAPRQAAGPGATK